MSDPIPLSPEQLASDLSVIETPLFGGFQTGYLRRILESALHYAGLAERYRRVRSSNRASQKRWRAKRRKTSNVSRGT